MTIQEFIEKQIRDMAEFKRLWRLNQYLPDELEYPDWQDNFRNYLENLWIKRLKEKENKENE